MKSKRNGTRTVSMLELRTRAEEILERVRHGEHMVLTYRGQPVMRLEPYVEARVSADDAFYRLDELVVEEGGPLSNDDMDRAVYGA